LHFSNLATRSSSDVDAYLIHLALQMLP